MAKFLLHAQTNKAKMYPYMGDLVSLLLKDNHEIKELLLTGQEKVPNTLPLYDLSYVDIYRLLDEVDYFICVDSFLQHLVKWYNKLYIKEKKGAVIWCLSNPEIFGHKENLNIYKNKVYFKSLQHEQWTFSSICPPDNFWIEPTLAYKLINKDLLKEENKNG
jgi:hypothetical protein